MRMDLPKVNTSNLWDQTYNILKDRIVKREFGPNQKLLIPELTESLGISRTPIRDALTRLEMEGLVRSVSKVGTFVTPITKEDIVHTMDSRLMLETWTIQKLDQMPKDHVAQVVGNMERLLKEAEGLVSANQVDAYLESDFNLNFHIEFLRIGHNPKNLELYQELMNYRYIHFTSHREMNYEQKKNVCKNALREHSLIVKALKKGNREEIQQVITSHLNDSQKRILQIIESRGGTI